MNLLLIHHDTDDREMYADYLRLEGFAVTEVSTTDEAIRFVADADIVISGLMVQGSMGCVDLIASIRRTSEKPVVVVTACTMGEGPAQAEAAGANAVLFKPCLPSELAAEIRSVLGDRPGSPA